MHGNEGLAFDIGFDFVDHTLVVATNRGEITAFELHDGLSVAEFDEKLHARLAGLGIEVAIRETPFGLPTTTPFPSDWDHASYDRDAVERFWRVLEWTDQVFEEFAGWFCGKTSPVHLFWHSFDLALTRFGGRPAPTLPAADPVNRETYSHEVISFGFWPGDQNVREPSYYSYAAPEPAGLRERGLRPREAVWSEQPNGSLALLHYEAVRTAADPKGALLAFLESAYQAGAQASGWNLRELASAWCPSPPQLDDLLERGVMVQASPDSAREPDEAPRLVTKGD
jgi:hypothetical protein